MMENKFAPNKEDIEVGIKISTKVYLHTREFQGLNGSITSAFEIDDIDAIVENKGGGSIIYYREDIPDSQYSSLYVRKYEVVEEKSDIEEAISKVKGYKEAALETINSLLK